MKAEIYNLIILDESGSMSGYKKSTISGCNETLNTIRTVQNKHGEAQDNYVSIFVFQNGGPVESRYLVKNLPIGQVNDVTDTDYNPWGNTPLYDAVGMTLADLKATTAVKPDAIGNVTIITDGYENSSTVYSREKVVKLIDQLKELGWSINFIGANIDVEATAASLHIDSSLEFDQNEQGLKAMFAREAQSREEWAQATVDCCIALDAVPNMTDEERRSTRASRMRSINKKYFKK